MARTQKHLTAQESMVVEDITELTGNEGKFLKVKDDGSGVEYVTAGSGVSPLTTKGDLYTFSTVNTRLPVGTDGQLLSADSSEATGLKWIDASGVGDMQTATYDPAGISEQVVGLTATQELSNKTLDGVTIKNSSNISFSTLTGSQIGTASLQKLSFWGQTPTTQSTGWTITNKTERKTLDCDETTINQLADIVGTLVDIMKEYGLLG